MVDFSFDTGDVEDAIGLFGKVKDVYDQYIVRPINAFGLGGFVFDIEGESITSLTAEITDHFTEGNYYQQDHIAIRPKRIILTNYVGELCYLRDEQSDTTLQKVVRKLTVLDSYLPQLTQGVQQIKNLVTGGIKGIESLTFEDGVSDALNIWSLIKNLNPPIPRQQQAYQFFKALMDQKILVSVQTPFEFANNMAIESITSVQSEDSRFISEFTIVLKEMRLVRPKSKFFSFIRSIGTDGPGLGITGQPINAVQSSETINGGRTQGIAVQGS